uniref:RVP_2 domain-containing protein n=1 Tax=Cajanus cajan TaxID=3821 RepID=A0A151T967_CAJCA|nr:hypothetical protein KK1_018160 [Cajanus cajan]
MILVDLRSSHNIIQPYITLHLQLITKPTHHFFLMIKNSEHITCSGFCPQVPIIFQHLFIIPCYLLPIQGIDVIMGIEWLRVISPLQDNIAMP